MAAARVGPGSAGDGGDSAGGGGGGASGGGARVAVIGAGVSGTLTAIHLLWRCRADERVYLVERAGRLGPGVAYGTRHPLHFVNVSAAGMSAYADEPDHFARWLERLPAAERGAAGLDTAAGLFVRREVYGRYVQEQLRDAIARQGGAQNLFIVDDEAVAVRPGPGGTLGLEAGGGRTHPVDAVVLAVGNFPPEAPDVPPGRYAANPWTPDALDGLRPDRPVLLLGTGLTAVDVALTLFERGHAAPVYALSRRGLLPQAHAAQTPPWPDLRLDAADRRTLATLCRALRREVGRASAEGVDWRGVVDALRPSVQLLWQELAPADRQRFLRHLRPWWQVHRHRAPPPVAEALAVARAEDRLRVLAGRVAGFEPSADGLRVAWHPRGRGGEAGPPLDVQRVVDCRGPGTDYARLPDPLTRQLLAEGLARPDPCRLGLGTTPSGSLVDASGRPSPALFAVGPVTRGTFWDIVSVPEISAQAERVAETALAAARARQAARLG